eukprot:TRINITY_DN80260_c0_g1_i1.p1 TRINITY_DN80260_c0_g1~~TRINITY_DN80260_c0_g1_i1.p1  ORF type:complete len:390 (+),score=67.91 TRINITY_DN80260_c0_g1_i1:51-1172(+)
MDPTGHSLDVVSTYERIFMGDDKDVTFKLADGEERAHRLILKSASDVFASMFQQDMREKSQGLVELPDTTKAAMRVFLRLIYTGHVDSSDWLPGQDDAAAPEVSKVLRLSHMTHNLPRITSEGSGWSSAILFQCTNNDIEFSVRAADWSGAIMIGIAPKDTQLGSAIYTSSGFYGYVDAGALKSCYAQDGTAGNALSSPVTLQPNSVITVKLNRSSSSLSFSVDGGLFQDASFSTTIPNGVEYCPAINIYGPGKTLEVLPAATFSCPLEVLLSVAALAKKYMVKPVVSETTQVLKTRLAQATASQSVEDFQQIVAGAIAFDMGPVRMAALDCAKTFHALRAGYEAGKLMPDVAYELEAIWPGPASSRPRSRLA